MVFRAVAQIESALSQISYASLAPVKRKRAAAAAATDGQRSAADVGPKREDRAKEPLITPDILPIPRSLNEIYAISNRNRQQNQVCTAGICTSPLRDYRHSKWHVDQRAFYLFIYYQLSFLRCLHTTASPAHCTAGYM